MGIGICFSHALCHGMGHGTVVLGGRSGGVPG